VNSQWKEGKLSWRWEKEALRLAAHRDGAYLLRTNLTDRSPDTLWRMYVQLTEVEAVFRALKSDLAIRPIWHWVGGRVEAHVMVAFLGYCLWICLKQKLKAVGPTLTPWAVAGPVQANPAGRGMVQTESRRRHLPAPNYTARIGSSHALTPTGLDPTRTASATNLQRPSRRMCGRPWTPST